MKSFTFVEVWRAITNNFLNRFRNKLEQFCKTGAGWQSTDVAFALLTSCHWLDFQRLHNSFILDVFEIYRWHCFEQWTEAQIVDCIHLEQRNHKLVVRKKNFSRQFDLYKLARSQIMCWETFLD